ncbi:unnamed protein product [Lepeophtheirus salmonis]|uniref:(salmon louse) hypothetical protein n=1 Tax=Lepeophtheirus salmonis TaxID=72036 RepID=A0A7R8CW98_LEPSM|nr:unnamed protein product [Lepeophtheirus salmonis]CAF2951020.1 unnamed protein product [Lepeophtheirus salmonis]
MCQSKGVLKSIDPELVRPILEFPPPIHAHYDSVSPLFLTNDASPICLGAILSHLVNREDRPIAHSALRSSSSAELSPLKTDHRPLQFVLNPQKDLLYCHHCLSLPLHPLRLSIFDHDIMHVKGIHILHADALS